MCLQGGYKVQSVVQIGNLLAAFDAKLIGFRALRLYFAALAAVAVREAASRQSRKKPQQVRYSLAELGRLVGCGPSAVRRELRALEGAGLILYSESQIVFTAEALPYSGGRIAGLAGSRSPARLVPLSRRVLRFLARCSRVAVIKTVLAYCVRGLSLERDGTVKGKGTVKASWIADHCQLSLRAVRDARAFLIRSGFISADTGSKQWKLNRDGSYFSINLDFGGEVAEDRSATGVGECAGTTRCFAPPRAGEGLRSAPPYEDPKTPFGSKHQETPLRAATGVRGTEEGRKPNLRDIRPHDLKRVSRLRLLFALAVKAGWIGGSQADLQNFVAAAVRANRIEGDPVRVFVAIVRKKLWHHITLEQEQRACEALRRSAGLGRANEQASGSGENSPAGADLPGRALTPLDAAALLARLANRPLAELSTQP